MPKTVLTATPQALTRLRGLLRSREKVSAGVRVSVRRRGCTGRSYVMSFVDREDPMDHKCPLAQDVVLFVDPKALMFLIGTKLDYTTSHLEERFVFQNPNEKGRCGCGESFYA